MADRDTVLIVPAVVLGAVVGGAYWCWARWRDLVAAVLTEEQPRRFDRDRARARRRRRQGEALSTRRHEFR